MSFKRWSVFIVLMVAGLFTAGWSAYIPARLEDRDALLAVMFTVLAAVAVADVVLTRRWIVLLCLLIADGMTALAMSAWPNGVTWFCAVGALAFAVTGIVHVWQEAYSRHVTRRAYLGNALKSKG